VTPNVASKTYGSADPALTGSLSGFLAADGVTATYSRTAGEMVAGSPYPISATLNPAAVLGNYSITYNTASFTINKATLTVTADNKSKMLNAANPPFTASYSGFKYGDTLASSVTGSPSLTTTATTTSPVGSYPITAAIGTLSAANYSFAYVNGALTVQYAAAGLMCNGDAGHQILQPINADGSSVFKLGSTVPTKFRVCDSNGVSIGSAGVVTSYGLVAQITDTGLAVDETQYSTTPDTAFRWDSTAQQWIFNQSTKNNPTLNKTNTRYYLRIYLNDGSWIDFQYGLK
jgi:MBG domain (YGX type)